MIKCQFLWVSPKPSTNTVDLIDVLPDPPSNDHISQQTGKRKSCTPNCLGKGYAVGKVLKFTLPKRDVLSGPIPGPKTAFFSKPDVLSGFIPVPKTAISVGGQPFQITFASNLICLQKRAMFPASFFSRQHNCWLGGPSPRRLRDGVAKGKPWETVWAPSLWNRDTVLRGPGLRVPGVLPPPEV